MLGAAPTNAGPLRYPVPGPEYRGHLPAPQPPGGRQDAEPLRPFQTVRILNVRNLSPSYYRQCKLIISYKHYFYLNWINVSEFVR